MDYNARYYDPVLGRFVSAAPLVPAGCCAVSSEPAEVQSFDRYAYVANNPVNHTDPTGHCAGGIDTAVCIGIGLLALKVIDYGWTAYDGWQAGRTLNDPKATSEEKSQAATELALIGATEVVEPDELLPVGLPLDDLARKGLLDSDKVISSLKRFEKIGRETIPDVLKAFGDEARSLGQIPDHFRSRRVTTIGRTPDTEVVGEKGEHILLIPGGENWNPGESDEGRTVLDRCHSSN